jgi:hypothetical protein
MIYIALMFNEIGEWWNQFGGSAPNLQKLAIKVLSHQTDSTILLFH